MKSRFVYITIFVSFLAGMFSQEAVSVFNQECFNFFRRVKQFKSGLITGSEIEKAIGGEDNWDKWGMVGIGECKLNGQDVKIVRKKGGKSSFCKMLMMHLLDEYFVKTGKYDYDHMPVPLTFSEDGNYYYYMYINGGEGFYWQEQVGPDNYDILIYELAEFREWDGAFQEAGIKVDTSNDIVSLQDSGSVVTSKNYILDEHAGIPRTKKDGRVIYPPTWRAIDVDSPFYKFDKDKFGQFLSENRDSLAAALGNDKLALLELAYIGYVGYQVEGVQGSLSDEFNRLLIPYQQEVLQEYLP